MKSFKTTYSTLILLCFFSNCQEKKDVVKSSRTEDIKQIANLIQQQQSDWNNGNLDGYMNGYWNSDNLQFIVKKHIRKGFNIISASYKRHYHSKELMGKLSFDKLEYQSLDDANTIYQVTGNWKVEAKDTSDGNFSLILKKFDKDFKIIIDHTF